MVHLSARLIQGYKFGKNAVIEIGSLAFLLGTALILFEVGRTGFLVVTRGLDAIQTMEKLTGHGFGLLFRIFYTVLNGMTSFLIDFSINSPILALIAILLFLIVLLATFVILEGALLFLVTYISLSFYMVTATVNWNAFVSTYDAATYPLGPLPYFLIPPFVLTLYAYQLAANKLESTSPVQTIMNGVAVTVGYEAYAVPAFLIFVGIPKAFVTVLPGWEWFIRFNRPLTVVVAIVLLGYPLVFGFLGSVLAALAPETLPEYDVESEETAFVFRIFRDIGRKISHNSL